MGEMVTIPCPAGHEIQGYLAQADNPKGAIVVLQEWWGLNDQIKGVCDRFAQSGYSALAPDLYEGRVTQDPDEANHMMTGLDWGGAVQQEVRGALHLLKKNHSKTAVMGFCMGGALTIIAGVRLPECDAAVCYYGIPPKEVADPGQMTVPYLGHFATQDDWCTPDAVNALRDDMKSLTTTVEIHEYEGDHGFFNETREVFVRNAAEMSWDRTISFLDREM